MTDSVIAKNVAFVKAEIARAAAEAGRDPAEIRLVAATKMNDADRVREAIQAGVDICGENRVQEMLEKNALGAYEGVPLHFIGHLQKNKVRQVVGLCELIHSVDSLGRRNPSRVFRPRKCRVCCWKRPNFRPFGCAD